ncbi:MAG TPA: hypothetical protein VHG52_11550, partial [Thermomicrobiales bacterium]|nr:hypothetical protein [Thermomicrobiales bacterium]
PGLEPAHGLVLEAAGPDAELHGTPSQVEWAERIRRDVYAEFDRVAASFRSVATSQPQKKREETEAVISILEDKRIEVMAMRHAGYFKSWQEITDQVRQMIFRDARYQAIKSARRTGRL